MESVGWSVPIVRRRPSDTLIGGRTMRPHLTVFAAIAACLVSAGTRADEFLNIGDPAPKLAVSSWVKGEKVAGFEPGKTYVVEFWATWCGPCRTSIPHLTELAHKYKGKGVRFIGVDAFEDDTSKVKPFVDEMGDKMDYGVAMDEVPAGGTRMDGAMAKTWMNAAEEHGIPTAFIVHDGKIAWIGHPMKMDEPLANVVAGKWDLAEAAGKRLAAKAEERKFTAARTKVYTPYRAKDYRATLSAIEEVTSSEPKLAQQFATLKLNCLCKAGEIDAAAALGETLLKGQHDNAQALNSIVFPLVDLAATTDPDPRIVKLALRGARRANELTNGRNPMILDTLAVALYRNGEVAEAAAMQEKSVEQLEAQTANKSAAMIKDYRGRLERFRKEAADKGGKAQKP